MQLEAVAQALYPDTTGMYEYEPRCTTAKITGASWAHCVEQAPFYGDYGTNGPQRSMRTLSTSKTLKL